MVASPKKQKRGEARRRMEVRVSSGRAGVLRSKCVKEGRKGKHKIMDEQATGSLQY